MTALAHQGVTLAQLFADTRIDIPATANPDATVADITTDSRRAVRGGLFFACAGQRSHGLEHLEEAIAAGVAMVAWEPGEGVEKPDLPATVVGLAVPRLREVMGVLVDRFFGSPSAGLAVTGITGTNGKSTTAYLVAQALTALGEPAGYMGTLGFGLGMNLEPSVFTTPFCVEVHRRLRGMADAGARHVVMEVSSHALDQQRVAGVRFRTAALTNITRDHLDYHGDMGRYAEAKARLFMGSGIRTAVINIGNTFGAELASRMNEQREAAEVLSVALVDTGSHSGADARLIGHLQGSRAEGVGLRFTGDFGAAVLDSSLWGRFNAENLLVATGILLAQGFELDVAVEALRDGVAPPGRMELIRGGPLQPTVVIDYAHTPDALGKALEATREHTDGQVWCVFGCGGNRDRGKRAQMGAVAAELADHAVITDDNPRDEDPRAIIEDILAGTADRSEVIQDRRDAINHAIRSTGANDAVLIAGKGHELVQKVGKEARQFSDAQVARHALGRVA